MPISGYKIKLRDITNDGDPVVIDVGNVLEYDLDAGDGLEYETEYGVSRAAYDESGNLSGYSDEETIDTGTEPPIADVALSSNGGSIVVNDGSGQAAAIDGIYTVSWWATDDGGISGGTPATAEITFSGAKTITQLDIVGLSDTLNSPLPDLTTTGTLYVITAFKFQYWNGSTWVDVPGTTVAGNNFVWKRFTGLSFTTTKIRLYITGTADGYARVPEIEAWGS